MKKDFLFWLGLFLVFIVVCAIAQQLDINSQTKNILAPNRIISGTISPSTCLQTSSDSTQILTTACPQNQGGGGVSISTPDQGYTFFPTITFPQSGGSGSFVQSGSDPANTVYGMQVILPWSETARRITINVNGFGSGSGKILYLGWYSLNSGVTTLLASTSFPLDGVSTGTQQNTLGTSVVLPAGPIVYAWGVNTTNATYSLTSLTAPSVTSQVANMLNVNANKKFMFQAANTIGTGMPSSLGVMTAISNNAVAIPMAVVEP